MEAIAASINDTAKALSVGRTSVYALIKRWAAGDRQTRPPHSGEESIDPPPARPRVIERCHIRAVAGASILAAPRPI